MDKIDVILKEWAQRQRLDESKITILTESICQKVRSITYPTSQRVHVSTRIPILRLKVAYTSLGIVVGILLLIMVQKTVKHTQIPSEIGEMTTFSERDIKNSLKVVSETKKVFPDNLRWVQTLNAGMNLGLVSRLNESAIASECIMLHIVILKRHVGEKWQNIWKTEVASVPGEFIEVSPDAKTGNCINFWTHRVTDDIWVVDADIKLKFPFELTASTSSLFKLGRPGQVLSVKSGDVEYRIFEIVTHAKLNSI